MKSGYEGLDSELDLADAEHGATYRQPDAVQPDGPAHAHAEDIVNYLVLYVEVAEIDDSSAENSAQYIAYELNNILCSMGQEVGDDTQAQVSTALARGGGTEYTQDHQADAGELLDEGHGSQKHITGNDVYARQNKHEK